LILFAKCAGMPSQTSQLASGQLVAMWIGRVPMVPTPASHHNSCLTE
jgi:hypothetical protein